MENNDNKWKMRTIADLLRDAPKGTRLYSPLLPPCEDGGNHNLTLDGITDGGIIQCAPDGAAPILAHGLAFGPDGEYFMGGNSTLWPSRDCCLWCAYGAAWFSVTGDRDRDARLLGTLLRDCPHVATWTVDDIDVGPGGAAYVDSLDGILMQTETPSVLGLLRSTGREVTLPACGLRPFDRVLARDGAGDVWRIELFERYVEGERCPYSCISASYAECVPYDDDTARLLGTTDGCTREGE